MVEIKKSNREVIRVEKIATSKRDLVHVRIWYSAADGTIRPSKRGLCLRTGAARSVAEAILKELGDG